MKLKRTAKVYLKISIITVNKMNLKITYFCKVILVQ